VSHPDSAASITVRKRQSGGAIADQGIRPVALPLRAVVLAMKIQSKRRASSLFFCVVLAYIVLVEAGARDDQDSSQSAERAV
jgi:hypothetical protein